jgi:hypothetical protein
MIVRIFFKTGKAKSFISKEVPGLREGLIIHLPAHMQMLMMSSLHSGHMLLFEGL